MNNKNQLPKLIGKTFAHLQNGVDNLVSKGFSKLSEIEKSKTNPNQGKFIEVAKKAAGFLGSIGKSYYKEYDKIKQDKK